MKVELNQLSNVSGIGQKTMDRIKEKLLNDEIKSGHFIENAELENNCIYQGDMRSYMNGIKDNSVDLIVTDPPYPTTSRGNAGNSGGMLQKDINRKGKVFENNNININDWIHRLYRVLKPTGHCYIMTNHKNLQEYLNAIQNAGFYFIKNLIWDKGNKIMGQYYMSQYEYIIFCRKGAGRMINDCGTPDILKVANQKHKHNDGSNWHDTEKPVDLMKILVKNSSQKRELILDPFMGVGSTMIAAKELNRDYIGIELDKKYYDITSERLG